MKQLWGASNVLAPHFYVRLSRSSCNLSRLAGGLGLQDLRHFVGGGVPLEVAGNGEAGVARAYLSHTVWAAG